MPDDSLAAVRPTTRADLYAEYDGPIPADKMAEVERQEAERRAHWNPIVQLSKATNRHGADVIASAARMLTANPDGLPYRMALRDLEHAHAAIGAAIAEYKRATAALAAYERGL